LSLIFLIMTDFLFPFTLVSFPAPLILQSYKMLSISFPFIRLFLSLQLQNLINNNHVNNKNNVWSVRLLGHLGITLYLLSFFLSFCTHNQVFTKNLHKFRDRFKFAPPLEVCKIFFLIGQSVGTLRQGYTNRKSWVMCGSRFGLSAADLPHLLHWAEILSLIIRSGLSYSRYLSFRRKGIWSFCVPS
jgi:hypothetical protein